MSKVEKHDVKHLKDEEKQTRKSEPAYPVNSFDDMERMFSGLFPRGWLHPFSWPRPQWEDWLRFGPALLPRVDIIDRDHEIVMRAQVPGMHKENLDVSVSEHLVTIKGKATHEEKEEKGDYYRRECSRGAFTRTVDLPCDVDSSKARASFKDGMLELVIPKASKAGRHSVTIE